jgi:hypothetical protein
MPIRPEETRSADKLVEYLKTHQNVSSSYVTIDKDHQIFNSRSLAPLARSNFGQLR